MVITYLMMNYASGRGRETAIRVASEVSTKFKYSVTRNSVIILSH